MATDIVIPAKNAETLIEGCLDSVIAQLDTAAGDRVVVVDDASTDRTAQRAQSRGAHVLRLEQSVGPYEARNLGVAASTADLLVFADVRSRALPGWLESHKQQLSDDEIALSCTNVQVLSGPSFAERVSAIVNMFDLCNYLNRPGQLDYFPTCNLGVRRSDYAAAQGFRPLRSGGDADFCWRVQRSGAGRLSAEVRVLMVWKPRSSLRELVEQSFRYGRAHPTLRQEHLIVADEQSSSGDGSAAARSGNDKGDDRLARLRSRVQGNPGDMPAVLGSYGLVIPSTVGRAIAVSSRLR